MEFKNLLAYKKTFDLAMIIYEESKSFPKEERYSLTDQVRKSSRSVCANISEAYRKRKYHKHFISKLTDADAENSESSTWLDFALSCGYLTEQTHQEFIQGASEVGRLINYMINNPEKFGVDINL